MNSVLSLDEIMKNHDILYSKVLQDMEPKKLLSDIKRLVDNIEKLAESVDSFDDYRWLSDAAIKWQSVYSTILKEPRIIRIPQPKSVWFPSTPSGFSEAEITNWIERQAAFIGFAQRTERGTLYTDKNNDWHTAEVFFASEVLEGKFNFASRISHESYWRLENIWLKEVKSLMAYFRWVSRKENYISKHDQDYFEACNHIRDMLVNRDIKARGSEFAAVKNFIQEHYLGNDGKHLPEVRGHKLNDLIEKKAHQIYETTGSTDQDRNWVHAETYVRMFYENIIPAVVGSDEERVLRVLKAFQFSKLNRFIIINCFETALAIYFLDPQVIQSLWDDSKNREYHPESTVESIVAVASWPQRFVIPELCKKRFWFDWNRIGYKGVMLPREKDELLKALGKAQSEHAIAIEVLYEKSRQIHKETTL